MRFLVFLLGSALSAVVTERPHLALIPRDSKATTKFNIIESEEEYPTPRPHSEGAELLKPIRIQIDSDEFEESNETPKTIKLADLKDLKLEDLAKDSAIQPNEKEEITSEEVDRTIDAIDRAYGKLRQGANVDFKDEIYDPHLGLRQYRIKTTGEEESRKRREAPTISNERKTSGGISYNLDFGSPQAAKPASKQRRSAEVFSKKTLFDSSSSSSSEEEEIITHQDIQVADENKTMETNFSALLRKAMNDQKEKDEEEVQKPKTKPEGQKEEIPKLQPMGTFEEPIRRLPLHRLPVAAASSSSSSSSSEESAEAGGLIILEKTVIVADRMPNEQKMGFHLSCNAILFGSTLIAIALCIRWVIFGRHSSTSDSQKTPLP